MKPLFHFAALSIAICSLSSCALYAGAKPEAQSSVVDVHVAFAVPAGEDLTASIKRLADIAPQAINVEIITSIVGPCDLKVPGFEIPTGNYSLAYILNALHTATPEVTWSDDGTSINVFVRLAKETKNPFDDRIAIALSARLTPEFWLSALQWADNSAVGFRMIPTPGYNPGDAERLPGKFEITEASLPIGTSIRVAMNPSR